MRLVWISIKKNTAQLQHLLCKTVMGLLVGDGSVLMEHEGGALFTSDWLLS